MDILRDRTNQKILAALFLVGALAVFVKLAFIGVTTSSDSFEYIQTAMYLNGESDTPSVYRILKPLGPVIVASIGPWTGYEEALIVQSVVFYFLLMGASFLLAYEFFRDRRLAVYFVLLIGLSYPILKYGIDVYTETGALFFYVLSLYLTVRYAQRPSNTLLLANIATVALGFLMKEYSVVSGVVFGLIILFHPDVPLRKKVLSISLFAAVIAATSIPIQIYTYMKFGYSYFQWYTVAGNSGFDSEFTVKNIIKSTAALIGLAWLLVPLGLRSVQTLDAPRRRFLYAALPTPFMGYAWGYVSSRLLYVLAVPFLLVALLGMRAWSVRAQYVFVGLTIAANIAWLFLSYRITL